MTDNTASQEYGVHGLPNMLQILRGDIHLVEVAARIPARYGIATVTNLPQAFVRLDVAVDGRVQTGIAADFLAPRWFTKDPGESLDSELRQMLRVIEQALQTAIGMSAPTPFELWHTLYEAQHAWGHAEGLAPLLTNFGVTLVERALLEAVCKAWGMTWGQVLRDERLGVRFEDVYPELKGCTPGELLPAAPLDHVIVRQTVGIGMALTEADAPPETRLHDGLPESLSTCMAAYGLRHFKIKLGGEIERDTVDLGRIAALLQQQAPSDYAVTIDGNEAFRSLDQFRSYWETLARSPEFGPLRRHLLYVEQPLHRSVALDPVANAGLLGWAERPLLIIDESDAEFTSLRQALALGYAGTSHKNCKGVFHSVLNACYLRHLQETHPGRTFVMSGEDMGNIGPVALLQDLAVAASLGIDSVERNGHHYFAGLSMFSPGVQQQVLAHHADLYHKSPYGWPTLNIRDGQLSLESVNRAPLGIGFELDMAAFTTLADFRRQHPATLSAGRLGPRACPGDA